MQKLFKNVVSQDSSGRNATNTFLAGKGDVLLTYESEAVAAQQAGQNIAYLVPGRDDADRAADRPDQDQLEPRLVEEVHRLHEDRRRRRICSHSPATGRCSSP